jgi:hypothetical protein
MKVVKNVFWIYYRKEKAERNTLVKTMQKTNIRHSHKRGTTLWQPHAFFTSNNLPNLNTSELTQTSNLNQSAMSTLYQHLVCWHISKLQAEARIQCDWSYVQPDLLLKLGYLIMLYLFWTNHSLKCDQDAFKLVSSLFDRFECNGIVRLSRLRMKMMVVI